jgi:biotin carboxyl carrier protein
LTDLQHRLAVVAINSKKEQASVPSSHSEGARIPNVAEPTSEQRQAIVEQVLSLQRSPNAAMPASGQPASGAEESDVHRLQQVFPAQRAEHIIRPRFECLVERVYVKAGQTVKKGAALVDVSSIELAAAKNDYLNKELQLKHYQRILGMRRKLYAEKAISEQLWTDTQNDEEKSKLEFQVARDKLKLFGLDDEAIGLVGKEDGDRKARLTLRAPVDGIISKVDVELGNLYDPKRVLLILRATSSGQSTQP